MPLILQRLLLSPAAVGVAPRPGAAAAPRALHPAWVVVFISVWLAAACNVPLWREVAQLPG
ncbi:MAG: phosphoethanolamine transferase, partial [Acidovorax sp.]